MVKLETKTLAELREQEKMENDRFMSAVCGIAAKLNKIKEKDF